MNAVSPDLLYALSNSDHGNLAFAWGEQVAVIEQRQTFFHEHNLPIEKAVVMAVEHSNRCVVVTDIDAGRGILEPDTCITETDALLTAQPGLVLTLLSADCIPMIIYDPTKRALALLHLGWRSTGTGLIANVFTTMHDSFESQPKNCLVHIGPSIRKSSYRKATDLAWQAEHPEWMPFQTNYPDGITEIDNVGFALAQLHAAGVKTENIHDCQIDTFADQRYYSHYRSVQSNEPEARFMTAVAIRP